MSSDDEDEEAWGDDVWLESDGEPRPRRSPFVRFVALVTVTAFLLWVVLWPVIRFGFPLGVALADEAGRAFHP